MLRSLKEWKRAERSERKRTRCPTRRIKTEEKAKVVAAVWETELIQFQFLAIWHQNDLRKSKNSSYSSYRLGAIHPILHIIDVNGLCSNTDTIMN